MGYMSEAAKVRDMQEVMKYITGKILDVGCGGDKITPEAMGADGRELPGVDIVGNLEDLSDELLADAFDTIFSSHFLEHCPDQYGTIEDWRYMLKRGGHLVLYLPDGRHYNNQENPEHMIDMNYDQFIFWFKRSWCGEGKDFRGKHLRAYFSLIEHGMDIGEDRYSFYIVAKKL